MTTGEKSAGTSLALAKSLETSTKPTSVPFSISLFPKQQNSDMVWAIEVCVSGRFISAEEQIFFVQTGKLINWKTLPILEGMALQFLP